MRDSIIYILFTFSLHLCWIIHVSSLKCCYMHSSRERTSERSKSTAFPSRYSLSSIYNNRKSLPNHQGTGSGAPTSPHSPALSTDQQDFDMNGMDMFSRKSVAIFERLNKEQVCIYVVNCVSCVICKR